LFLKEKKAGIGLYGYVMYICIVINKKIDGCSKRAHAVFIVGYIYDQAIFGQINHLHLEES